MLRALDLFCGAGGATKGLQFAGFHVTGVDLAPQPRYCGDAFFQGDALKFPVEGFDFVWASPPCQAYSPSSWNERAAGKVYPDLVAATRDRLKGSRAYCIENVPGAPLEPTLILDGWMFPQLRVIRKRLFEASFFVLAPKSRPPKNLIAQGYSCVVGGGRCSGAPVASNAWHTQAAKQKAMGIDWMRRHELAQAVPPAYAQFIGESFLRTREAVA
jgi:DNA (cytosine-5)-methyltransferase 1